MAAVVPIEVPAINLVRGIIATMRIIKGMERITLTIKASGLLIIEQESIPFFSVTTRSIPRGMPAAAR